MLKSQNLSKVQAEPEVQIGDGKETQNGKAEQKPRLSLDTTPETPETEAPTPTTPGGSQVVWQWEHRTGFRDYPPGVTQRIEDAYQAGRYFVRAKTGKSGTVPMEIFFNDFLQHDPVTTHSRRVRRLGRDTCKRWLWRNMYQTWTAGYAALTGRRLIKAFEDYERHRLQIQEGITEEPYRVEDFYSQTGCCSRIAKSKYFLAFVFLLIFLNSCWIGIETAHYNNEDFDTTRKVVDHVFCALFVLEILIRFGAFEIKRNCWYDPWFVFDFALTVFMIIETWILVFIFWVAGKEDDGKSNNLEIVRILRMLKLARLGRFARLMAAFPELMTLVKGIAHALRSVAFTAILIFILLYVFSIYFTTHAQTSNSEVLKTYFGTVKGAAWILLMAGVFVDGPIEVLNEVKEDSPFLTFLFVSFIVLSSLTVLNMLIGVLCTVVDQVYQKEKEDGIVNEVRHQLLDAMQEHSEDGNDTLKRSEFDMLLKNPEVNLILARFDVDVDDLKNLRDGLYNDKYALAALLGKQKSHEVDKKAAGSASTAPRESATGASSLLLGMEEEMEVELTFSEFLAIVLRLRGGNSAKVNDIVELREYMKKIMDRNLRAVSEMRSRPGTNPTGSMPMDLFLQKNDAPRQEAWTKDGTAGEPTATQASGQPVRVREADAGVTPYVYAGATPAPPTMDAYSQMLELMAKLSSGQQQLLARQQELEARQAAWQKDFLEQQSRLSEQVSSLSLRLEALHADGHPTSGMPYREEEFC